MMGRFFMYTAIGVLAVFVLSTYVLLQHGDGSIAAVQNVSVHDLTVLSPTFDGQPVNTRGTLRYLSDPDRFELEDEGIYGLVLRIDGPIEADLSSLIGERVTVAGVFHASDEEGYYIVTHAVQPIDTEGQ